MIKQIKSTPPKQLKITQKLRAGKGFQPGVNNLSLNCPRLVKGREGKGREGEGKGGREGGKGRGKEFFFELFESRGENRAFFLSSFFFFFFPFFILDEEILLVQLLS